MRLLTSRSGPNEEASGDSQTEVTVVTHFLAGCLLGSVHLRLTQKTARHLAEGSAWGQGYE